MPTVWVLPRANATLSNICQAAGWPVTLAGRLSSRDAQLSEPDVAIYDLDEKPPSEDFVMFCQLKFFPVLAIAADWDIAWEAMMAGADDAIVGPIDSAELLFRARRLVHASKIIRVGELTIDRIARRVKVANRIIHLSPVEFRLLACLAKSMGEAVTFNQILDEVWGTDPERGGTREQVASMMKRLRKKIEPDPNHPQFIITIRGYGFRLRSQAQWEDNSEIDPKRSHIAREIGV